jgi:hypothetical protein
MLGLAVVGADVVGGAVDGGAVGGVVAAAVAGAAVGAVVAAVPPVDALLVEPHLAAIVVRASAINTPPKMDLFN